MIVREDEACKASTKRVEVPRMLSSISQGRGAAVMTHSDGGQWDDVIRAANGLADANVCQARDCTDVPGRDVVHRDAREIAEDKYFCQPSCPGLLGLCRECTVSQEQPTRLMGGEQTAPLMLQSCQRPSYTDSLPMNRSLLRLSRRS